MNNNKLLKSVVSGKYFVEGDGFTGTRDTATRISVDDIEDVRNCAKAMGLGDTVIEDDAVTAGDPNIKQNADGTSFAVSFVRRKDLDGNGGVKAHKLNPSKRRFATHAEATHHGARFTQIEKHLGFYVTQTKDPVNAYVNKVTGKTNPVIGRARTNR